MRDQAGPNGGIAPGPVIAAGGVVTAVALADTLPVNHAPAGLLLVAAVVGGCVAVLADVRVACVLAVLAVVLATVLLGTESFWWRLFILGIAAGLGFGQRWLRAAREDFDRGSEAGDDWPDDRRVA